MTVREDKPLSTRSLIALGINGVVGVGIFFAPADIAVGAPGNLGVALFAGTALVLLPVALVFVVLARMFPQDGGVALYVEQAVGQRLRLLVGAVTFLSAVASTAAVIGAFVDAQGLDARVSRWARAAVLLVLAAVVACGLRVSSVVWQALTALKLLPLVALAALGLCTAPSAVSVHAWPPDVKALASSALICVFALQGFEVVPLVAGQARKGAAGFAVLVALAVAALLYAGIQAVVVRAHGAATSPAPLVSAARNVGGDAFATVMRWATNASALGVAFGMVAMTPRYFTAAKLTSSDRKALAVTVVLVGALLALGSRRELFAISSLAVLVQYGGAAGALTVLALRKTPGLTWRHAVVGASALLVSIALAIAGSSSRERRLLGASAAVLVVMFVTALWSQRRFRA